MTKYSIYFFLMVILTSCSLAPKYQRPEVAKPYTYKESGKWLVAKPTAAQLDRGSWWRIYHDPMLNQLEERVVSSNQNLKAALARYEEARAALTVAKADYFPTITGVANANRQHASTTVANPISVPLFNDFLLGATLNYELDVWGRVRNAVASARNRSQASAADLALVDLSLHAELANDYFALRGDDAAQQVLDNVVKAYQKALYLTKNRYQGGAAPVADVDEAINQLEQAKTSAADMRLQRAQLEHAIAVLIGEAPAAFSLKPVSVKLQLVTIQPDLPSTLLERRPDIAEAEYLVQAANADIGVARAAFFPAFNLSTSLAVESATLGSLFKSASRVWGLGPTTAAALLNNGVTPLVTQTLFDGGRIAGLSNEAWAHYDETVAKYRQIVLTAYQEVEDSLVALHQLDHEYHTQTTARDAAHRALAQAMFRYKGGLTTYLDVVVIQNIALQAELSDINIRTRRQIASVQLIKALGGGWDSKNIS